MVTAQRKDPALPGTPRSAALAEYLREETTGGKLLLAATAIALLWANLAGAGYDAWWGHHVALGPAWLELDLSLAHWASDGLLAIFFFVAGMEVKREFTVGELADRRAAGLPFFAALGGMAVPAVVALAVSGGAAAEGRAWAVPMATDIAFALGILALIGSSLPAGARLILLSLAVIDDLVSIAIIAVLFAAGLEPAWILGAAAFAAAYWASLRRGLDLPLLLWALGIACWVCVHASGIHATVAGVVLGLLTPVRPGPGALRSVAERFEHRLHPISAGAIVPVFALAAAGVSLAGAGDAISDPVALGIAAGLLVGKPLGILGGIWLALRLRAGALPAGVGWGDVVPVAVLGGIGYTVSLLIAHLAFADVAAQERAAAAVLAGSALASVAAALLLRRRRRRLAAAA